MPSNLLVGAYAIVEGPRGGTYTLRRPTLGEYTCDCAAFQRLHTVAPASRTCRHLMDFRGETEEFERIDPRGMSRPALMTLLESLPRRHRWGMRVLLNNHQIIHIRDSTEYATPSDLAAPAAPQTVTSNQIVLLPQATVSGSIFPNGPPVPRATGNLWHPPTQEPPNVLEGLVKAPPSPPKSPASAWDRLINSPFGEES